MVDRYVFESIFVKYVYLGMYVSKMVVVKIVNAMCFWKDDQKEKEYFVKIWVRPSSSPKVAKDF